MRASSKFSSIISGSPFITFPFHSLLSHYISLLHSSASFPITSPSPIHLPLSLFFSSFPIIFSLTISFHLPSFFTILRSLLPSSLLPFLQSIHPVFYLSLRPIIPLNILLPPLRTAPLPSTPQLPLPRSLLSSLWPE